MTEPTGLGPTGLGTALLQGLQHSLQQGCTALSAATLGSMGLKIRHRLEQRAKTALQGMALALSAGVLGLVGLVWLGVAGNRALLDLVSPTQAALICACVFALGSLGLGLGAAFTLRTPRSALPPAPHPAPVSALMAPPQSATPPLWPAVALALALALLAYQAKRPPPPKDPA